MRFWKHVSYILAVAALIIAGCGGPPDLAWETLDRYDGVIAEAEPGLQIPAKHLYEWMYFSRTAAVGGMVVDSVIKDFRDSVLIDTLVGLTTSEYDFERHWYHHRDYVGRVNQVLEKSFWQRTVNDLIEVDSQEVVDYYEAHADDFYVLEQAEVYHILSNPLGFKHGPDSLAYSDYSLEELEPLAEERINNLYRLLVYGEAFENVAYDYSQDVRSRDNGGRLGWVRPGRFLDPFDSVVFSLENGEFSRPYQDMDGWHLVYRTNYVPAGPKSLDSAEVYSQCVQSIFAAKAAERGQLVLDSLHQETSLTYNDLLLTDTVVYLVDDSVWAAIVNDSDTLFFFDLRGLEDLYRRNFQVGNTTPEIRKLMVRHAAGKIRIRQAASDLGLDTLPDYVTRKQTTRHEMVKSYRISRLYGKDDWVPEQAAIEQYYEDHFDEYNPKHLLYAKQLLVQDEALAYFLQEQAMSGLDLGHLHSYFGAEGEGYEIEFEDLGLVKEGEVDTALYSALERTHRYRVAPIVKTDRGYHVAKVFDREYRRPLDLVKSEIAAELIDRHQRERWEEFRDQLFAAQNVRFPSSLPKFYLPRLSDRNHPRTLPKPRNAGH
jgi:hypothetical protein